jgi:ribonuclease HI
VRVTLHCDGGSRGNPGPAGVGVVITDAAGEVVGEVSQVIGIATNNVAEYEAVIRGLERAAELGATEVDLVGDSELIAKQITGAYKVKHPDMKPLHAAVIQSLKQFDDWTIRTVPRAQNSDADALVNQALDAAG